MIGKVDLWRRVEARFLWNRLANSTQMVEERKKLGLVLGCEFRVQTGMQIKCEDPDRVCVAGENRCLGTDCPVR